MKIQILRCGLISLCIIFATFKLSFSQTSSSETAEIQITDIEQTVVGFGASLAYYENWLTAHPKKAEIYDIIFKDLSLDIIRLRNAYAYDPGMIGRVKEFYLAAEASLGYPIETMSCSWSPAGYVKSNNHHKGAGGTLKYTLEDGTVQFDYSGFANWWDESLDEYESNGISLDYISIQNEPDWPADYESCRLDPEETITSSDTIAAYNTALDSVYNKVIARTHQPKIIGPETIGIGFNAVEKYVNKLDETKIDAISHHLYHGVSENNPFVSTDFTKVGNFHPEIPHFQTEFYRGDWFSLGGLIYKSFHDENVAAYLFWALTWGNEGGLVALENPWSSGSWTDPTKGYIINKEYYAFKQFSAFIHPGWSRVGTEISGEDGMDLAFVSPDMDSAAYVIVNRSLTDELEMHLSLPGCSIEDSEIYITTETRDCELSGTLLNYAFMVPPHSIVTVAMEISECNTDVLVEQIDLSPEKETIDVYAESILITPEILPADATNKALFWEITSGAEYAQISQLGYLEALGAGDGTVVVRATTTDGSDIYSEISVDIVNQILIGSINLSATKANIEEPFDSTLITAAILPEDASIQDVTWKIIYGSDIASLESTGWLYALGTGDGDVRVRVSANDASGKFKEIIIKLFNQVPLESIAIIAPFDAIDTYQGTMQLSANYTPEAASNKEVTWSIEEGALLAAIDQSGMLEALGIENGEVTVKAESQEDPEIFDLELITLSEQVVGISEQETSSFKAWSIKNSICFSLPASPFESQIYLYSIDGRKLHQMNISPHFTGGTISMEEFGDHIYLLELKNNQERQLLKIAYVRQ